MGPGTKAGIRAGSVSNGHSYASWVAHLATLHLGAAHVSIVEAAGIAAAVQAGMIDLAIGPPGSLDDIPPPLRRIEFDCDPARPAQISDGVPLGTDTILYPLLHIRTTAGFRYPLAVWRADGCDLLPGDADPRARDAAALGQSTLIAASPVQLAERLQLNPREWQDRAGRTIIVLGDRLPVAVHDTALATACGTLLVGYGSTETGSIASGDSALIDHHPGAVGFVRAGATVEIGDAR